MRLASAFAVLLMCSLANDAMAGLALVGDPVTLSDSQRTAIEKVACANSPGKTTIGIRGYSAVVYGHRRLAAWVQCDDGIELDEYHAYFEHSCTKKGWRWSCEKLPQIRLYMKIADGNPHEIKLDNVSLDDALRGLNCFETVLSQNPQVLDGGEADHQVWLSASESQSDSLVAYLEAHNECYWIEYPRQCSANAREPLPVSIKTGCIDE